MAMSTARRKALLKKVKTETARSKVATAAKDAKRKKMADRKESDLAKARAKGRAAGDALRKQRAAKGKASTKPSGTNANSSNPTSRTVSRASGSGSLGGATGTSGGRAGTGTTTTPAATPAQIKAQKAKITELIRSNQRNGASAAAQRRLANARAKLRQMMGKK